MSRGKFTFGARPAAWPQTAFSIRYRSMTSFRWANSWLKKLQADTHLGIEAFKAVAQEKGQPGDTVEGNAGNERPNRHLRVSRLSADQAALLGTVQWIGCRATNANDGDGSGVLTLWLLQLAHPVAARGQTANHKGLHSLYQAAGLMMKRHRWRQSVATERELLSLLSVPNKSGRWTAASLMRSAPVEGSRV